MNLLNGKLYDPAVAVTKATSALLAMTALDTTNLRLLFTVPASGIVRVRMEGTIHGATTFPTILLGILQGSTVMGRQAPVQSLGNTAVATAFVTVESEFLVTGLTPAAALTWDAAYAVETVIAATGIKYGGPNDTTGNNGFGGFAFEIWDPCPVYTPAANGVPPTTAIRTALDVVDDLLDTELAAVKTVVDAIKVTTDKFVFTIANKVDSSIQAAADFAQTAADKVWLTAARILTAGTNIVLAKGVGVTGFTDLSAAQVNTECDTALADVGLTGTITGRIDAAISSRLATAGYTTPPTVIQVRSELDANSTKLDVAVGTRLSTAGYTAPDNTSIAAIQVTTDKFVFSVPNKVDTNLLYVNGIQVIGSGTAISPWSPV